MGSRLLIVNSGASDPWLSEFSAVQLFLAWIDCMPFHKSVEWVASSVTTLVTMRQVQARCRAYLFFSKGVELWHSSTGFILDNCTWKLGALFNAANVIAMGGRKAELAT
jgi:hypothetical protein